MRKDSEGKVHPDLEGQNQWFRDYFIQHSDAALHEYALQHPPRPVIRNHVGQGMLHCGDIVCIKAQVGQGKTQACSILAAAALGGAHSLGLDATGDCDVLYFDTEMSMTLTDALQQRVSKMCNGSKNLHVCNVNDGEMDARVKADFVKFIITDTIASRATTSRPIDTPLLVFVDGVAELVEDTNDIYECKHFASAWTSFAAAFPVVIVFVIHENQGQDNGKMTGHLGSYLMKKAREVYRVKRQGRSAVFTLSNSSSDCKYTYGSGLPDFSWQLDENGMPTSANSLVEEQTLNRQQEKFKALTTNLQKAFDGAKELPRMKLEQAYRDITGCKESTAYRAVNEAVNSNILIRHDNGLYELLTSA